MDRFIPVCSGIKWEELCLDKAVANHPTSYAKVLHFNYNDGNRYSNKVLQFKRLQQKFKNPNENPYHCLYKQQWPSPAIKDVLIYRKPLWVLDAVNLANDFYRHLLVWGKQDILATGLNKDVYLINMKGVNLHVSLSPAQHIGRVSAHSKISSLAWANQEPLLSVGCDNSDVGLWDSNLESGVGYLKYSMGAYSTDWSPKSFVTAVGTRNCNVLLYDVRLNGIIMNSRWHTSVVCGLKWNCSGTLLASGSEDNTVVITDIRRPDTPVIIDRHHKAAVKAIDWKPSSENIIVTGGGSGDMSIRIWNTHDSSLVHSVITTGQICNLIWSSTTDNIISSHGAGCNNIIFWNPETLKLFDELHGHMGRIPYMTLNPSGTTLVTGSADESIRIWDLTSKKIQSKSKRNNTDSIYNYNVIR